MQARRFYPGFNPAEDAASNLRARTALLAPDNPMQMRPEQRHDSGASPPHLVQLPLQCRFSAASGGGNLHSGEAWVVRFQSFTDSTL